MHRIKPKILRSFFRKLWMVANINGLFYPFSFYSAYLLFGPWFVGEILQDQIGVVFSWGTLLNNNFLPGSMSYFYGFLHVLTFNVPLLFILGNTADHRFIDTNSTATLHQNSLFGLFSIENSVIDRCPKSGSVLIAPSANVSSICQSEHFLHSIWSV